MTNVHFLGHVISQERIQVDHKKVETMTKWPRATTITDRWGFLGLIRYYCHLVKDFSKIYVLLTKLTCKGAKFI